MGRDYGRGFGPLDLGGEGGGASSGDGATGVTVDSETSPDKPPVGVTGCVTVTVAFIDSVGVLVRIGVTVTSGAVGSGLLVAVGCSGGASVGGSVGNAVHVGSNVDVAVGSGGRVTVGQGV